MENLNDLLGSISAEDMERIKSVASSLMTNNQQPSQAQAAKPVDNTNLSSLFGDDTTNMLMSVATQMNKENDKTAFIKALRPLLSDERRTKADEAIRFMKLMDTLPLLKGLF